MKNILSPFPIVILATLILSDFASTQEIVLGPQIRFAASVSTGVKNPIALLRNRAVQEELAMDEKQTSKLKEMQDELNQWRRDAYTAARKLDAAKRSEKYQAISKEYQAKYSALGKDMKKTLNEKQLARYDQIVLQMEGANALSRKEVADKLKMAEEQRQQVIQIREEISEKQKKLMEEMRNRTIDHREYRSKVTDLNQQKELELFDILTQKQSDTFKQLTGEKFEFPRRPAVRAVPAPIAIPR